MRDVEIKDIYDMAMKDKSFEEMSNSIRSANRVRINVTGPSDPMKIFLWAALKEITGKSLIILVQDELKARKVASGLREYGQDNVYTFSQREYSLIDVEATSREEEFARLAVLDSAAEGRRGIYIVTAGAGLSRLMPLESFRKLRIRIRQGAEMSPEILCGRLLEAGYERVQTTDAPGLFAGRGDIVDIVLPGEILKPPAERTGIRVSFFGDEIDAVKIFSLDSQRTVEMAEEAVVYPAREVLIAAGDEERIAGLIEAEGLGKSAKTGNYDCERIRNGIAFPGTDRYIHLVYPESVSFLDYFDEFAAVTALDELGRIRERMDSRLADFYEGYRSLLEKEKILPCSSEIVFKPHEVLKKIDSRERIINFAYMASAGSGITSARHLATASRDCPSWRGNEKGLAKDLSDMMRRGVRTIIVAPNDEREEKISAFLSGHEIYPEMLRADIKDGFEYPAAGFLIVGESHVFSSTRKKAGRHRGKGIGIDLFSDLKPGDAVVHEIHGVGKYCGLKTVESGGAARDYLKIEYLGGDSLYISTDNLDQIQKYVGSEGRQPKLSKLGGQEWNKLKEKARSSIRILATNLVKLYADRMALRGYMFSPDTVWQKEFEDSFPYELTDDQERSTREIKEDMESDKVMDRLLCGDVGFGKTEVAFRAIFKCVLDGKQAAVLVPTTVLAHQHYETLNARLKDFPVKTGLLSRFASDAMIKETKRKLASGALDVVIGTHMVLSEGVRFKDLGLLVIDEEQRFGVDHKEKLKEKFPSVDVLTLTATPIPRTLHMSMSGIRDISVLEEPPPERRAVQTYVMEYDKGIVGEAMLREISRKGQVFYLFNNTSRIMEKAAEIENMLPGARVAVAHGKMRERQLENVIDEFVRDEYDVLVCTTIIESGIDMPNVNTIIVENAERFGLAQLYQLKGRVGRSGRQAYAYITYKHDKILTEIAEKRLAAIRDYTELGSGFKIALKDLEVRGAGNLLGGQQHGHLDSIGYDLYCRMLEEEIKLQSGEISGIRHEALVEIDIDAYIPSSYVTDEGERMDMYRKVAKIADLESYMDALDEISDRYGDIPSNVATLSRISYIRNAGGRAGFARIWIKGESVVMTYRENFIPDMQSLASVLNDPEYKGKVLFNAGSKPYLVLRGAAVDLREAPDRIFGILMHMTGENTGAKGRKVI
ncbi:MAG: transcription-repair coupling factor [Saccharofermentanales bacterium]